MIVYECYETTVIPGGNGKRYGLIAKHLEEKEALREEGYLVFDIGDFLDNGGFPRNKKE